MQVARCPMLEEGGLKFGRILHTIRVGGIPRRGSAGSPQAARDKGERVEVQRRRGAEGQRSRGAEGETRRRGREEEKWRMRNEE